MNVISYKKPAVFSAFAILGAITFFALTNDTVRSERVAHTKPPFSKFQLPPPPGKNIPNKKTAPASAGDLEDKWSIDFGSYETAYAAAVQTDGKVVAAGTAIVGNSSNGGSNSDFAVFRYNADGSLDTSFGIGGKVTTSITDDYYNYDAAYAVAIQTDGKIIAAGRGGPLGSRVAALVRYNPDGSLDASFGQGGIMITDWGYGAVIAEIALQTDGKIIAAGSGYINNSGFIVARYNSDGSLDPSFGTGGMVTSDFGDPGQTSNSVTVQPDGKIVAAGATGYCDSGDSCYFHFAIARYNTDGSPDTSFGTGGKLTTSFGGDYETANDVLVQSDGKIVAAGYVEYQGFAVARYNEDGSLDNSFDGDGKVIVGSGYAFAAHIQPDAKIVVAGTSYGSGSGSDFALVRLNTDGSLDAPFGSGGMLMTDFGKNEYAYAVAIKADGKIVSAGYRYDNRDGSQDFALAQYKIDGSLDPGFDADGKVTTSLAEISSGASAVVIDERSPFDPKTFFVGSAGDGKTSSFAIAADFGKTITPVGTDARPNAAAIDPFGNIVAAGYTNNGSDFALVRYFGSNLRTDPSFGANGIVTSDFGGSNEQAKAVAIQADYKIVVVGETDIDNVAAVILARYNYNGTLDTSFGSGGSIITQAIQFPTAMAIQPDGKIIAAGNEPHPNPPYGSDFALARFNLDGSLDTSFDGDGVATTHFDLISRINSVVLLPHGKIVAAGITGSTSTSAFALARYNADGSLDTSFDTDGKVTTQFDERSEATAVKVQRNGRIVAVGYSVEASGYSDFAIARYDQNGFLDTTFDSDGKQTTDFFGDIDGASAVAIQRDGKIVAAGTAYRDNKFDFAAALYTGDATAKVNYDYDNDGLADIAVFRPSDGNWYIDRSTQGFYAAHFGISSDKLAPADFDGDGKADIAVFRGGTWYWLASSTGLFNVFQFGLGSDIPVPGGYAYAQGRAELTIYREGSWWSYNLTSNRASVVQFGLAGDKPVPADYDGDGFTDQAVYRDGVWHLNRSSLGYAAVSFGLPTDLPVVGDYDGDGKADPAVFRDGIWYLLQSTEGFSAVQWGLATDIPVPADYDGDGKTDIAVFRDGVWYLLQSTAGMAAAQFGLPNDKPIPAAYLQ